MYLSLDQLKTVASQILKQTDPARKFTFQGDLGAGKTTLIKALCETLGVEDLVSSPTYSIINEYEYANGLIRHMDLYRLKNLEEAIDIGIEDYLYDDSYCFIEWPELIFPLFEDAPIKIHLEILDDFGRNVLIS